MFDTNLASEDILAESKLGVNELKNTFVNVFFE